MVKMKCTFDTLRDLYSKQVAQEKAAFSNNQAGTSVPLENNVLSLKLGALNSMHSGN